MARDLSDKYRYTACIMYAADMPGMDAYMIKTLHFTDPLPGTDAKRTGQLWARQFGHVVADELEILYESANV